MLTIGSLFSGTGGLELGLLWAGLGPVIWQCETNPFCRSVLKQHWPGVERFEDVITLANPSAVDLICGGFPCQDISAAGKGAGLAGSRSGLWYQFARIVGKTRPDWVVVENVAGGANRWVDAVCGELEQLGYETLPIPVSAEDVGAPHLRRRVFIVAHAISRGWKAGGLPQREGAEVTAPCIGSAHAGKMAELQGVAGDPSAWFAPPEFRRVDDGVPDRVGQLHALGNAVVPQCAEVIGWVIRELISAGG